MRASLQWWIATTVLCVQALIAAADGESVTHVVRPGDTLSRIARRYYGDAQRWDRIATANNLENGHRIREGQRLVVPLAAAPETQAPVAALPASTDVGDTVRPVEPAPPAPAAQPIQPSTPSVVALDSEAMRRLAAAAVVQHYTNLNLSEYDPGYLVRLESPNSESEARLVVSWLGREALAVEKSATPDLDRKKVLKIEVWMTEAGRVLEIRDRPVWLNRSVRDAAAQ